MCQCLCSREARAIPEYYFALIISIDAYCYFVVADSIFYHLSVTVLFLSHFLYIAWTEEIMTRVMEMMRYHAYNFFQFLLEIDHGD